MASRKMEELTRKMRSYLSSLSYAPPEARQVWRDKIDNVKRQICEQEQIEKHAK